MKHVTLALAGLLLVGVSPALAQYHVPRPPAPIGPMAADDVLDIVEGMGLRPIGPAVPNGRFLVQRARDDYGRLLHVTVDARRSQVIAIERAGALRAPYGRYAGYGPQRRVYPGYAIHPDDDEFAAPGSATAPRVHPVQPFAVAPPPSVYQQPQAQQPQKRATKSAAVPPQHTPVPRKRPATAPEQAAAGSVQPAAPATPQNAPAPETPPAPPAAEPQATNPAVTPVTPLE